MYTPAVIPFEQGDLDRVREEVERLESLAELREASDRSREERYRADRRRGGPLPVGVAMGELRDYLSRRFAKDTEAA
jgi:hypothetical protein